MTKTDADYEYEAYRREWKAAEAHNRAERMAKRRAIKAGHAAAFRARWAEIKAITVTPRVWHASMGNTSGRPITYRRGDEKAGLRRERRAGLTTARQQRCARHG